MSDLSWKYITQVKMNSMRLNRNKPKTCDLTMLTRWLRGTIIEMRLQWYFNVIPVISNWWCFHITFLLFYIIALYCTFVIKFLFSKFMLHLIYNSIMAKFTCIHTKNLMRVPDRKNYINKCFLMVLLYPIQIKPHTFIKRLFWSCDTIMPRVKDKSVPSFECLAFIANGSTWVKKF